MDIEVEDVTSLGDKGLQTDDDEDWSTKAKKKKGKQPKKNSKSTKALRPCRLYRPLCLQPPRSRCALHAENHLIVEISYSTTEDSRACGSENVAKRKKVKTKRK
nr:CMF_HP1_G0006620.mRNA.1.CDS.1 [Saccharomyces cerevisiae]